MKKNIEDLVRAVESASDPLDRGDELARFEDVDDPEAFAYLHAKLDQAMRVGLSASELSGLATAIVGKIAERDPKTAFGMINRLAQQLGQESYPHHQAYYILAKGLKRLSGMFSSPTLGSNFSSAVKSLESSYAAQNKHSDYAGCLSLVHQLVSETR